jgi:hypothetical protein
MSKKDDEIRKYAELMGQEAAQRQAKLAAESCKECGYTEGKHHSACRRGRRLMQKRDSPRRRA